MLQITDLRKSYGATRALDGVSFEVKPGEIFGLLGPNGAGKTTTIRISLGIIEPDSGTVLFNGKELNAGMKDSLAYLPEERGLYRKSRVIDVLVYFGGLRNVQPIDARKRAMHWLEKFELSGVANHKVDELSKGMQQKVQFISCLLHEPELLILDEPFSGLDPVNQIVMKDLIREMKTKGKTIIFSTHQMEQAERLCDEICLINKGRVVLYGGLGQIKRKYGDGTIHMEFEGESSNLKSLGGIAAMDLYENYAEVRIRDGVSRHEFLKQVVSLVDVTKFSVEEASLNSIFINAVNADKTGGENVA
ncbi:MAG: ABC transporter ATP-binding protein [Bacteroidetes bacterium]|nr:ABC transporter ATP-binding protein [Bacteroidota bacterium]MCL5035412.1 ABC transporter ATP-binding protein [Bacteroidota bacterium]